MVFWSHIKKGALSREGFVFQYFIPEGKKTKNIHYSTNFIKTKQRKKEKALPRFPHIFFSHSSERVGGPLYAHSALVKEGLTATNGVPP